MLNVVIITQTDEKIQWFSEKTYRKNDLLFPIYPSRATARETTQKTGAFIAPVSGKTTSKPFGSDAYKAHH